MKGFRYSKANESPYPVKVGGKKLLGVELIEDAEDKKIWDEVQGYYNRTADELDRYLRSYGYRLAQRVYVDAGPDKGRGGELWLSRTGFPIKAETKDGVVVKIQRKVVF